MNYLNSDLDKQEILKLLFINYFDPLVLNAIKYVSVPGDAEEIVQDVFVKVWYELDNLPADTDFKAYLYRSVYNSCMNFLRHKEVNEKYRDDKERETPVAGTGNISEFERNEVNRAIEEALDLLPEKWREVFLLSRYEELKYHEIAGKLSISQKTVEKYISKSLQFLKVKLKDFLPFLIILKSL